MTTLTTNTPNTPPPIPGSGTLSFIRRSVRPPDQWLDGLWIVLAEAKDTGGRFSMMKELMPKGLGPGLHKHTWSDESYYMLRR